MSAAGPALVLGIGNRLLRDDGVGIAVVRELERRAMRDGSALPAGTQLVDGGTLGLDLLALLADARAAVFVDAMELGVGAGAVAVLDGDALRAVAPGVSVLARGGLGDLLDAARLARALPEAVSLIGVQPGTIELGDGLTGRVRAAVPTAADAAVAVLRAHDNAARARGATPGACRSGGTGAGA